MLPCTHQERSVIIFYKALILGSVKTRLARTLGAERARSCYVDIMKYMRAELLSYPIVHVINMIVRRELCFWKPDMVQQGSSLEVRMRNAFKQLFTPFPHKALLMGSDIPYIRKEDIETAFCSLESADFCIFPSSDGGYSLVGMKENAYDIFTMGAITGQTTNLCQSLVERAQAAGLNVYVGRIIDDIDTLEDIHKFLQSTNKNELQQYLSHSLQKLIV